MPKKAKVSEEALQQALGAAKKANTADDLRAAQSVILTALLGVTDSDGGKVLGRSRGSVARMRKQFLESTKRIEERNWGGRRYGYMSLDEESKFLSGFFDEAKRGGVLVAGEIKLAFEARVGKKVAKTTIYRMLDRHGWRKIEPRPAHPKSDAQAQEGFKKTPKTRDQV